MEDYKILQAREWKGLENDVKNHLSSGWKLQGGVSISTLEVNDLYSIHFAQAMVK